MYFLFFTFVYACLFISLNRIYAFRDMYIFYCKSYFKCCISVCTQRVVYGFNTDTALASISIIILLNKELCIGQVTGPKSAVQAQDGKPRQIQ